MNTTLTMTELRQKTSKVILAVENGKTVTVTEHGKPKLRVVPISRRDKAAAAKALVAHGPVEFLPRK
jgi:prevent-host-death family protein